MARRDQYIISKTDFVLRDKHAVTNIGTIYENDHMTIVPDDGMYDTDRAMFSDSNFKFRVRTDANNKKKHFAGNWVETDDGEEYWSEGDCSATTITPETKIVIKPDYSSVKEFAYYGSAQELIKASIRDVLLKYPGGLYFLADEHRMMKVDGETYYVVSNEFGIDIWTPGINPDSVENPMKYLSASYDKYYVGESDSFLTGVTITQSSAACLNTIIAETTIGSRTFYTYLTDTMDHIILSKRKGVRGRPIIRVPETEFQKAYEKLDDFSKVLLNLDSKPIFKAKLETPYFDGQGYYMTYKDYTWPSVSTSDMSFFTPDMTSAFFDAYVSQLMELAEFHDEFDSDNIWRMLTHDSIKNLDWTFRSDSIDGMFDNTDFDSTRMKAALELCGRQFDDIKRYADNIKYSNTITYDEKDNVPDYFLTDSVDNDGWDAYHVGPSSDNSLKSPVLYSGLTYSGKSSSDANTSFLRRLAINSDYIQSLKGTKRGIEVILGMFGMKKGLDYNITEFISVANRFPKEYEAREVLPYYEDYSYGDNIYSEWPMVPVNIGDIEDNYMIPWFNQHEKYTSGLYFQAKGGWENTYRRKINLPITTIKEIEASGDIDIYGETLQYMKYASNIYELTGLTTANLFENVVCYVEDISGLADEYNADDSDATKIRNGSVFSHYFVLKNVDLSTNVGFVDNEFYSCYGWRNVFEDEYDGTGELTCDGNRVLYMESIKSVEIGNNPHVGYGFYDMGYDYLDHFRHVFKTEVENNKFESAGEGDTMNKIRSFGFGNCDEISVDKKTITFMSETLTPYGSIDEGVIRSEYDEVDWEGGLYENLNNPEGLEKRDEATSFSIINTKRINIEFATVNKYHEDYIEAVVLKYVEQMMPSTAIFSYRFVGRAFTAVPAYYTEGYMGDFIRAEADAVLADNDNTYMVEHPLPNTV